jgi:hypothetical protein
MALRFDQTEENQAGDRQQPVTARESLADRLSGGFEEPAPGWLTLLRFVSDRNASISGPWTYQLGGSG